jgi:hypothetical protein
MIFAEQIPLLHCPVWQSSWLRQRWPDFWVPRQ